MLFKRPPNPSEFSSLNEWAKRWFQYVTAQSQISGIVDPTPLLLAYRVDNVTERAAQNGLMLFDPATGTPVVAYEGAWMPMNVTVTDTTTNLADITNAINTASKYTGKMVFNTTTSKPVWAVGSSAASVWVDATGATAHTPV